MLFSVGANAAHGLPRTREDKRPAVLTLLGDAEWSKWSDREIARQCGVAHSFVGSLRPTDTGREIQYAERTFTHPKTGAPAQMRTGGINGNRRSEPPADPAKHAPIPRPYPNAEPVRSTVGESLRTAPAGPTPLQQRHIGLALDGLDRLLAASEFWPNAVDAVLALAEYPAAARKLPIVLEWLARLSNAAHEMQAECLLLEVMAEARIAREYDAAQDRGEVARKEDGRPISTRDPGAFVAEQTPAPKPKLSELGLDSRRLSEWPRAAEAGEDVVRQAALVTSYNLMRRDLSLEDRALGAGRLANLDHGSNRFEAKVDSATEPSTAKPRPSPSTRPPGYSACRRAAPSAGQRRLRNDHRP